MKTILIVDDEEDIREILSFNLTGGGYRCLTARDGKEALDVLRSDTVDLVLLDVMMPEMSGYEVAQQMRNDQLDGVPYDLPIIFLTALGEEDDQLRGFQLGADDYIAKPFSVKLLLARVEAVLRRPPKTASLLDDRPLAGSLLESRKDVRYETLVLDEKTLLARDGEQDLGLTKMEYELLHFLLQHQGVVYSRNDLLTQVWPENGLVLDRTVDVTINRLRRKLGKYKDNLRTKTGYGYYWEK